jgi:hypothetical protein
MPESNDSLAPKREIFDADFESVDSCFDPLTVATVCATAAVSVLPVIARSAARAAAFLSLVAPVVAAVVTGDTAESDAGLRIDCTTVGATVVDVWLTSDD